MLSAIFYSFYEAYVQFFKYVWIYMENCPSTEHIEYAQKIRAAAETAVLSGKLRKNVDQPQSFSCFGGKNSFTGKRIFWNSWQGSSAEAETHSFSGTQKS